MTFIPSRIAVVGATGPTGAHLVDELLARGRRVRVVSRSLNRLERVFEGIEVEREAANALDPEATRRAIEGCDLVVDCIGLPPAKMDEHPSTARVLVDAARDAGARCLQVSSYWAFLPTDREVIDESSPRVGDHPYYRLRREAEDVMLAAGAAVVHLPDFFGPRVHTSTVQRALEEAAAGGPIRCIGSPGTRRDAGFIPDLMRSVADLAEHEKAYGTDWGLPGTGPVSSVELARLAGDHLGHEVAVKGAPPWLLKILGAFSPQIREAVPLVDHYARPVRYDTSKLRGLLGEPETTPYDRAVPVTLDWIRAQGR
jgi:nucleoside-diphosphate-sugar epimerase